MRKSSKATLAAAIALLVATVGLVGPATAEPEGFTHDEVGIGYFYSTFNERPNIVLLAGGRAEDFCEANPGDPFNAAPSTATARVFGRSDGSIDVKVDEKNVPIHLYLIDVGGAPPWIAQVCADIAAGGSVSGPFASGVADLKVRDNVVSEDLIEVHNSVNGKATGTDGTEYRVRASADLIVENGVPVGDPENFVSFELRESGR